MRICLYTETALPVLGGQEMVVDALAREYLALGHEPVVLAPSPRRVLVADHEFPYPVVRHPRFVSTRHFMEWYKHWLLRAQRQHRFDLLHCHSIYPCGYLATLCEGQLGIPTVITSHGGDVHIEGRRLSKPGLPSRYGRSIAAADALIAISKFTHDGYLRLCPTARNIVSIPNGVDLEPFAHDVARPAGLAASIQTGEYFLFIGRLHPRKGVDVLLDALSHVPARQRAKLVIAGDGDERGTAGSAVRATRASRARAFCRLRTWCGEGLAAAERAVRGNTVAHVGGIRVGRAGKLCRRSRRNRHDTTGNDGPDRTGPHRPASAAGVCDGTGHRDYNATRQSHQNAAIWRTGA